MAAYYNEFEPYAAQWLRNLIKAGVIAPGDVDERSIEDVTADDIKSYTQCHFFAGIGVWSYALRLAGWPDNRQVWTASCPCQPFSAAGKGEGFTDERHLWPSLFWLIGQQKPAAIFGEQVAGKDAEPWLDLVQVDLEALGYRFGGVAFPSASIGAPHIRDRTYWMGYADHAGLPYGKFETLEGTRWRNEGRATKQPGLSLSGLEHAQELPQWSLDGKPGKGLRQQVETRGFGVPFWLAHSNSPESEQFAGAGTRSYEAEGSGACGQFDGCGQLLSRLADASGNRCVEDGRRIATIGSDGLIGNDSTTPRLSTAGAVNGFWRDADWLFCRDGRWRPVESGTFPLAHGAPNRVGRLRAYGNAINAEQAKEFIKIAVGYQP